MLGSLGSVLSIQSHNDENNQRIFSTSVKNNSLAENNVAQQIKLNSDQTAQKNTISSIDSVQSTNNFSKQGLGNNTLLKANETFSIQSSYPVTNSIVVNETSTTTDNIVPTFPNYNLMNGNFNISNVHSAYGIQGVETSANFSTLTSSTYSTIASSFVITQDKVNISSITYYLNEKGTTGSRNYNVRIRGIDPSGAPNGSIYFQVLGIGANNLLGWTTTSLPANNNTFSKGTYAIVIENANTGTFNWQVVLDNGYGDSTNSSFMWTKKISQNWNLTEYPADLPFYYSFMSVDPSNTSKPISYSTPGEINFKINNTLINSFSNSFNLNPSINKSFSVSTSISISFQINYFQSFKINSLSTVSTSYNISSNINLWTANITINALPPPTPSTSLKSVVYRNITILNLPSSWIYNNQVFNGSNPFFLNINSFKSTVSDFTFLLNGSTSLGNFKFIFSSPNYVNSIDILDQNNLPLTNFINGSETIHFAGKMIFTPVITNNTKLTLQNNLNSQIVNYTYLNASIYEDYYSFPLFSINDYFNLNDSYQGSYKLIFSWSNDNLTKIGYYEQNVYFVISTTLTIYPPRAEYYVGEQVFLNGTFSDFFNDTIYSNASVSYVTDWGLSGSFSFNNSNNLFETNISTLDASNGDHVIIITATGPYFANQSIEFTIDVDIMRPSSLNLISKNGFQFSNNNTAQLSSNLQLSYLYSNLLNSTPITSSNLTLFLNGNPINLTTNNKGITVSFTDNININLNLDPMAHWNIGQYVLTVNSSKFGFESQQKSLNFTVTGYKILATLSFNNKFIRGEDFHVRVSLQYSNQTVNSLLNKLSSNTPDSTYLFNITVSLNITATFSNKTVKTIEMKPQATDQYGQANFDLDKSITQNMNVIHSLAVHTSGSNVISDYIQVVSGLNIPNSSQSFPFAEIFMIILAIIIVIFALAGSLYFYRNYLISSSIQAQEYNDYIKSVTNFLGMYITTKQGLPVFLKSNQQLEDQNQHLMLSGVTYSIDLFLTNFKDEYTRTITKENNVQRSSNTGFVNMTVIDQENFKIIIGVSDSYRMYVLIRETSSRIMKMFQHIQENLEKDIHIERTIINLQQIYPLFVNEVEKDFPIELVNEFEVKFDKLVDFITNPDKHKLISASTLSKLKDLSFYLIKNSNLASSIVLDDEFDFNTIINNSKKIKVETLTLSSLMKILQKLKCSKKEIYEILFFCSTSKASIFKNITPISIPEESTPGSLD